MRSCLRASRLNGDRSRAHDHPDRTIDRARDGSGLGRGRGAHDKNGATALTRGWPLLFSYKYRVCEAPSTDRPGLPRRKTRFHPYLASGAPSAPCATLHVIGRHEFPLNPHGRLIMRCSDRWMAHEWFRDRQRARRRQIERFSRVSVGSSRDRGREVPSFVDVDRTDSSDFRLFARGSGPREPPCARVAWTRIGRRSSRADLMVHR